MLPPAGEEQRLLSGWAYGPWKPGEEEDWEMLPGDKEASGHQGELQIVPTNHVEITSNYFSG